MAKAHWQTRVRFVETDAGNPDHINPRISETFGATSGVREGAIVPFFILYDSTNHYPVSRRTRRYPSDDQHR